MKELSKIMAWPLIFLALIYKSMISPYLKSSCRFQPTCSNYAIEALRRFGIFKGGWLTFKRVIRCHPWGGSGYDPVPKKFDFKG